MLGDVVMHNNTQAAEFCVCCEIDINSRKAFNNELQKLIFCRYKACLNVVVVIYFCQKSMKIIISLKFKGAYQVIFVTCPFRVK